MPTVTPRRNRRIALRVLYATAPLALLTLVAWGLELVPDERQAVVFMAYQALVIVAVGAAIVAVVSHGQLGIARAFAAGYNTAIRQVERMEVDQPRGAEPRSDLHLVAIPPPIEVPAQVPTLVSG